MASVGPHHSDLDSGEADPEVEAEVPVSSLAFGAAARAALVAMDSVDFEDEFLTRACVIQCVPAFLRGLYRASMRFVLIEADRAREASDTVALSRAWKLFLILPRLLLHRPPRGGNIPKGFSSGSLILPQVDGPICWRKVWILPPKFPWCHAAVAVDRRGMMCADVQIVPRLWSRWVNSPQDALPSKVLS